VARTALPSLHNGVVHKKLGALKNIRGSRWTETPNWNHWPFAKKTLPGSRSSAADPFAENNHTKRFGTSIRGHPTGAQGASHQTRLGTAAAHRELGGGRARWARADPAGGPNSSPRALLAALLDSLPRWLVGDEGSAGPFPSTPDAKARAVLLAGKRKKTGETVRNSGLSAEVHPRSPNGMGHRERTAGSRRNLGQAR